MGTSISVSPDDRGRLAKIVSVCYREVFATSVERVANREHLGSSRYRAGDFLCRHHQTPFRKLAKPAMTMFFTASTATEGDNRRKCSKRTMT